MKTRLTLLFLLTLQFVSAQDLVWARHLAGKGVSTPANLTPGKSMGLGIAVDSQENVYVTGYCNDSVDFDPSSGSFFLEGGNNDIFLAKYSKSGGLVWAHVLVSDGWNYSYDVEVDKYDNVFITGFCASTADFDPDTGIALLSGVNGGWFYFIAKYNSDGKYLWANGFSAVNGAQSFDVCLDSNSNVYVTANFYGSIDIDPSSGSYILNGVNNGQSILCAKYDSLGSLIWGFAIDDVGQYGGASSISSDDGDYIYVTGYYGKPIDLDPSSSSFILTPNTTADRFVAKYKKDGTFIWARSFDVNNNGVFTVNRNVRAEADIDKNVVICGVFSGTVDLDPGSGIHQVISPGTHGTFFVKLDSAGNFVWGNAINNGFSMPSDFKIDCNNDIVITGSFTQGDFDPSSVMYFMSSHAPSAGANFLAKYNENGDFVWARRFGNNGYGGGPIPSKLFLKDNYQYVTGGFKQAADFSPDGKSDTLRASGIGQNAFFIKLSSNSYLDLGSDTSICQGSILLLDASHNEITSYQWSNGSTDSSISVQTEGTYWVNVQTKDCGYSSDTIKIREMTIPYFDLGGDTSLCEGALLSVRLSGELQIDSFYWSDGAQSLLREIDENGFYGLTTFNKCGSFEGEIKVDFINCDVSLTMPNVFTPNSDGQNESFTPLHMYGIEHAKLEIYNRWGNKIFETVDLKKGWNGMNNTNGTYYWVVHFTDIHGTKASTTGHVTLLKG